MDLSSKRRAILVFRQLDCKLIGGMNELRKISHKVRYTQHGKIKSFIINVPRPGFDYAPYRIQLSAIMQPFTVIGENYLNEYNFFKPVATPEDQQSKLRSILRQQKFRKVTEENVHQFADYYNI